MATAREFTLQTKLQALALMITKSESKDAEIIKKEASIIKKVKIILDALKQPEFFLPKAEFVENRIAELDNEK